MTDKEVIDGRKEQEQQSVDYERLYVDLLEALDNIGFSLQAQAKNHLTQYKNSKQPQQQQQQQPQQKDAKPKP